MAIFNSYVSLPEGKIVPSSNSMNSDGSDGSNVSELSTNNEKISPNIIMDILMDI